jgi:thiamine-phosphate pyrophosphorylase
VTLPDPPLLLITDSRQTNLPLDILLQRVLEAGCRWISLREKHLPPPGRLRLLNQAMELGAPVGAMIGIHGDIEAAAKTGAKHVHLPASGDPVMARDLLGTGTLIGVSAHTPAEIETAQSLGADYCTFSPIFPSPSKPGYGPALGIEALLAVSARVSIPVIALGGVEASSTAACLGAGAAGIAVMGGIMSAQDPHLATRRYLEALRQGHESVIFHTASLQ